MTKPSRKAEQSARTRAALIAAGRTLFAERGYAGVSAEEIAAACEVTTGAVYHQFGSKQGLFLAVFEALEQELTEGVAAAAAKEEDPLAQFQAAAMYFLAASAKPDVRQIVLIDARSVLGWEQWHAVMAQYGLGLTRTVVAGLIEQGLLPDLPADALATLLFGALSEGAISIATSADPDRTREETEASLGYVLSRLARGEVG